MPQGGLGVAAVTPGRAPCATDSRTVLARQGEPGPQTNSVSPQLSPCQHESCHPGTHPHLHTQPAELHFISTIQLPEG